MGLFTEVRSRIRGWAGGILSPRAESSRGGDAGDSSVVESQRPTKARRVGGVPEMIENYYLSEAVLDATQEYLELHGSRDEEGYVFWAGGFTRRAAYVTSCVYPGGGSRYGGVRVPLQKMTAVNQELRDRDQLLVAQVHSHPGIARHSDVDERKAATFHDGFVSIVVPDFGATPVHKLQDCGVYVYSQDGGWTLLSPDEVNRRFSVEEVAIEV